MGAENTDHADRQIEKAELGAAEDVGAKSAIKETLKDTNRFGRIKQTDSPLRQVVLPIFAIIAALLVFSFANKYIEFDCKKFVLMILAYPLFFGAAGIVLGGAITLQGHINILGIPWAGQVVGGLGAALVGAALVFGAQKQACATPTAAHVVPKQEIHLTDFPILQPEEKFAPPFFATVEYQPNLGVELKSTKGTKGTLAFSVENAQQVSVLIRAYQLAGQAYKYIGSCEIQLEHKQEIPAPSDKLAVYKLRSDRPMSLEFDQNYFSRLTEARQSERNLCLQGLFTSDDKNYQSDTVITPLQIFAKKGIDSSSTELVLFFTKAITPIPKDQKEATRQIALADSATTTEVLTSPGTGAATPAIQSAAPATKPAEIKSDGLRPSCLNSNLDIRTTVDGFLSGDDLDKPRRQQIYAKWSDINCYVLPIALNTGAKYTSPEQSRSIKLLISAIINNSGRPNDPFYWQPGGSNKRDFSRSLPFLKDSDIQKLFDLLSSDEELIRSEVLRFVKLLPIDGLERLFRQKIAQMDGTPVSQSERFALGAAAFYYNRMTEWLDAKSDVDKSDIRKAITTDFDQGKSWIRDSFFAGKNSKPFEAMLLYAKAIVQRERELDDLGRANFKAMLEVIGATTDVYPSRPLHIAQALAIVAGGKATPDILKQIQQSDQLPSATRLDENSSFGSRNFAMYAGPKKDYPPLSAAVSSKDKPRLLLRIGEWYFVSARDKIGWILRTS